MKYSIIIAAMLAVSVQASVTEGGRGIVHRKLAEYPDDSKLVVASYIVVFDDAIANVSTKSYEIMSLPYFTNATISNEYTASIKGISIDNVSGELLSKLLDDPQVSRVVPNTLYSYMQTTPFPPSEYESWGLDRIDQRNLPYDDAFTTPYNGTGVEIYILDSGINTEHDELVGGRAACGFDAINDPPIPCGDVDGHGTAMAAIAGGHYIGVAPGAELISVKIGNDDAVMSALLAGIEYVTQQKLQNPTQPMVASLSIGGFTEEILDIAIERMHDVGVFVAVAAGNEFRDACYASPARIAKVVTVGATGEFDQLWNGTNYGPCVDLFAPGDLVWHPSKKGNDRYKLSSGTSNAVPFVAGVAALYLEKVPRMLPTRIGNFLRTTATRQILTTPYKTTKRNWFVATSTPNRLLNLGSLLA